MKGKTNGVKYLNWQPYTVGHPTGVKLIYNAEATRITAQKIPNTPDVNTEMVLILLDFTSNRITIRNTIVVIVISFLVNVYRGILVDQPSFFNVALYISFFPKMAQGPIARFKTFYANRKKLLEILTVLQME